jgi:hypothetical protein
MFSIIAIRRDRKLVSGNIEMKYSVIQRDLKSVEACFILIETFRTCTGLLELDKWRFDTLHIKPQSKKKAKK